MPAFLPPPHGGWPAPLDAGPPAFGGDKEGTVLPHFPLSESLPPAPRPSFVRALAVSTSWWSGGARRGPRRWTGAATWRVHREGGRKRGGGGTRTWWLVGPSPLSGPRTLQTSLTERPSPPPHPFYRSPSLPPLCVPQFSARACGWLPGPRHARAARNCGGGERGATPLYYSRIPFRPLSFGLSPPCLAPLILQRAHFPLVRLCGAGRRAWRLRAALRLSPAGSPAATCC